MSTKTYKVIVTREENAWLADVPELDGTHTYARSLPALDQSVREVIAMVEDLPDGAESGLRISYEYHTGNPALDEAAAQLRALRDRVRLDEQRIAQQTAELAKEMVSRHALSVRDAAALIGVAPQRISQVAPRKSTLAGVRLRRARDIPSGSISAAKTPTSAVKVAKNPKSSANLEVPRESGRRR
ncbi:type II toxin-antitoxin system HicB family antitoxin [Micromonospora carbonacea]|uniref:Type II toxin-antitoxin system HicB family antitoxin n=1 Tax=Micromonospora carbonacea TaxID=47853 RepID=A0A1C5AA12_9ACTN|nr:hypothetical protein [Micromonospora carbonacea]SCF41966.1 hypothetical protein GA0070563_11221 [Micromonospora carbonacea]